VSVDDANGAGRSSLDDGKNNSRAFDAGDGGRSGRFDCRTVYRNMEFEGEGGATAPYRCGQWACYCCAHRMRMNLIESLEQLVAERPEMRRLLTLTISPETAPRSKAEQHAYITERWNALRTEINDRYPDLSYVWIRHEGDQHGRPHLHLLVDRYLDQNTLSVMAERVGLGQVVDIRRVNARNAAHYLTSYLGKGALADLPEGLRRYGSSADVDLDVRGGGGDDRDWRLMMDDYETAPREAESGPLRRGVTKMDIYLQKHHGGPLGLPPP